MSGDADGNADAAAVAVRPATPDDFLAVMGVLEGALLDVAPGAVRARIADGECLVAVDDARIVGALVRDGDRVTAVAVRRRWRRRGVGTALVERALASTGRLTAAFAPRVRGFYEALGFEVERRVGTGGGRGGEPGDGTGCEGGNGADGRLHGVRRG